MDLISVILPVYNRMHILEECVGSVLAQTYRNLEILLIDDGSQDESPLLCRTLAENDPRIRFFEIPHGGVSAARNKGLEEAAGDFVFFIDSDDVIHPQLLQLLLTQLQQTGAAAGGTGLNNVRQKNWHKVEGLLRSELPDEPADYLNNADALHALFHRTTPLNLIGGVMFRRELIGETRFRTDLSIGEDFYFIYQNMIKGADAVFLRRNLYFCRLHDQNSSLFYDYHAFYSRFYRRVLVWQQEEQLGRMDHAELQKTDAFGCYVTYLAKNKGSKEELKKVRSVMRQYRKSLLRHKSLARKLQWNLYIVFPSVCRMALRLKKNR